MSTQGSMTSPGGAARIDALIPAEMAHQASDIGVKKASLDLLSTFALSVLAGGFIAMGAVFATTTAAGTMTVVDPATGASFAGTIPYGITRLLAGLAFSLGLILVIVAGAELFTGNNLIVMAWASRRVRTRAMLRNWTIVYVGNFVGAIATVVLVFVSGQYRFAGGAVGATALATANAKAGYGFVEAFALGILCNALVCLAVWLTYSAHSTTDRILAIVPPVAAFVAVGFEHSIANMYFIPIGILIRQYAPPEFWASIHHVAADYPALDWGGFVSNLIPVTLGNIVGGAVLVAGIYWLIYLRRGERATTA
jgi:formate transporter